MKANVIQKEFHLEEKLSRQRRGCKQRSLTVVTLILWNNLVTKTIYLLYYMPYKTHCATERNK